MAYHYLDYAQLETFCNAAFRAYGFDEKSSADFRRCFLTSYQFFKIEKRIVFAITAHAG